MKNKKNTGPCYIRELRRTRRDNLVEKNRKKIPDLELICTEEGLTENYNHPLDNASSVSYAIIGCAPSGAEYYEIVEQRGPEGQGIHMKINYYKRSGPIKWRRLRGWHRQGLY